MDTQAIEVPEHHPKYKTPFDRLLAWHRQDDSSVILTDVEQKQLVRWKEAFTLLSEYRSTKDVVSFLVKTHEVCSSTAYADVRNCQRLYGDALEGNKKALRHLVTEWSKDIIRMAKEKKDLKSMNMAIANIIKANGLELDSVDTPDFEKLEAHTYNIQVNAGTIHFIENLAQSGAIDLSELRKTQGDDTTE